jgi:hypothetical protein
MLGFFLLRGFDSIGIRTLGLRYVGTALAWHKNCSYAIASRKGEGATAYKFLTYVMRRPFMLTTTRLCMAAQVPLSSASKATQTIQTTLYDLIDTIGKRIGACEEEALIIATVSHLLNTYRVTCLGQLAGYQFVCENVPGRR